MDTVDRKTRSKVMAAVKSRGNRSTEWRLRAILIRAGISGWHLQSKELLGVPDFVFERERLVIFVDGCFWHGCPSCYRRPSASRKYWDSKVKRNKARDNRQRAMLRRRGWSVMRIWEHELKKPEKVLGRIRKMLSKAESAHLIRE